MYVHVHLDACGSTHSTILTHGTLALGLVCTGVLFLSGPLSLIDHGVFVHCLCGFSFSLGARGCDGTGGSRVTSRSV